MARLESAFAEFISNIEPSEKEKKFAQDAHLPIREYLENDGLFKEYFESSFLYGSYKRNTATGNIKDIDIIVLTHFNPEETTPETALTLLKEALGRYYETPNNEEYQTRSIRVNNPLPDENTGMTLDVIPAIALGGEEDPILVPDRELQKWKKSNPKAHLKSISELNAEDYSNSMLVPLVKMMRWWWTFQAKQRKPEEEKVRPKGFWLECLVAQLFDRTKTSWAEHFVAVLEAISENYTQNSGVPALPDPGLPGISISTGMNQEEFNFFLQVVDESLAMAKQALNETDESQSLLAWAEIFGDFFPLESKTILVSGLALGDTSHAQQPPWPRDIKYRVEITKCIVQRGFLKNREIKPGGVITNAHSIQYVAQTSRIPEPYEVRWQVVNTGQHAKDVGGLRGGFDDPKNPLRPLRQTETTLYTGKHFVKCFIIQNNYLVAESKPFFIKVFNIKRSGYRGIRRKG